MPKSPKTNNTEREGCEMKKFLSIAVVLLASFATYIYSFTTIVLGDIYTSYPGQDSITVLIATLPAVIMMISAFASTVLLARLNRKMLVIVSLLIALVGGLVVAYVELPVTAVVVVSALMGIPGGIVAAANASLLPVIAPEKLKDKVLGWHQAALMLGQTVFALVCGFLAQGGNWAGGFRTVYILVPVIGMVALFYPNVRVDEHNASDNSTASVGTGRKMPAFVVLMLATYFIGCSFWNAWYVNNSDFIINYAHLGDSALVGSVNSLCTAVSIIGCVLVSVWMRGLKSFALPIAIVLGGVGILLPTISPTVATCYIAACVAQMFIMISISTIQTYIGLTAKGKQLTTAMSLLQCFEGSGVFLCGYVIPWIAGLFTPGANTNMVVGGTVCVVLGVLVFVGIKAVKGFDFKALK